MWQSKPEPEYEFQPNPYDSFMRKHLQHYGYYTGRNQGFRNNFSSYADWEKTFGYAISSAETSDNDHSDSDSEGGAGGKQDGKLQDELMRTTQLVYSYQDGKGMVPKLREPRNLYALAKELGPQQAARWPSDIQVATCHVKHIRYIPSEPEPFYKQTGLERLPMVRGEEHGGRLVFLYEPRSSFFIRSRVGGTRTGPEKCAVELESNEDTTLIFESRFESGNLAKAVQVGQYDYELWLRNDLYTTKHTQWFYFRVANTRPNVTYRFSIVNFMKPDSLYNYGMRPLMYSEKDSLQKKMGWVRGGGGIKYYKNNLKYETSKGERSYYSLTWTAEFNHGHDMVYFAHCYPYTYTDLQDYLLDLSNDPIKTKICKQRVLCRTLAGNLVYVLTITSPSQNPEDIKHKKAVVLTSRVHPGESNASWMMKGFLDYLTGGSADAKLLRDTFIFKIVPMLNPDGVVVGNYRCSLAGRDLNRNYKTVLKESYPSVWHTKNMIRRLLQEREIVAYCDLHGHSRRQNVFIYGCENRHNVERRLRERVFPVMLGKNAPDKFAFESCKFKVQKSKEGTGRLVMWNMGIMNSYTMEATFCGSTLGKKKGFHFSIADFESMGYHFCDTLLDYCDPDKTKCANILVDLEERVRMEILSRMEKMGLKADEIDLSEEYTSGFESSDGGSDSSVSDGPPVHLQFAASRPAKKKKKLKTKKERDREQPPEKKPMSGHTTCKPEKLQSAQQMRYTSAAAAAPKRPKSHEERPTDPGLVASEKQEEAGSEKNAEYLQALTSAYLKNGVINNTEQTAPHLRYSGSNKPSPNLPFSLDGLCPHHEQTFAAQFMAQHLQSMQGGDSGDWFRQGIRGRKPSMHAKTQDEVIAKIFGLPAEASVDELMRSQLSRQVSISPIDRKPMQRHILEVSAAQQRQQDILQQQRKHVMDKSGKPSGRLRTQIPSATFVNYETFKVTKVPEYGNSEVTGSEWKTEETEINSTDTINLNEEVDTEDRDRDLKDANRKTPHRHKEKSGRKSRMGMHEEEEEQVLKASSLSSMPDYVTDPHRKGPRVKSAHGGEDINSAIQSIRQLRQSLATSAVQQNLSPTTGRYIQRLIKQTNEDIEELTHEIEHDIETKKKKISKDGPDDKTESAASKENNCTSCDQRRRSASLSMKTAKPGPDKGSVHTVTMETGHNILSVSGDPSTNVRARRGSHGLITSTLPSKQGASGNQGISVSPVAGGGHRTVNNRVGSGGKASNRVNSGNRVGSGGINSSNRPPSGGVNSSNRPPSGGASSSNRPPSGGTNSNNRLPSGGVNSGNRPPSGGGAGGAVTSGNHVGSSGHVGASTRIGSAHHGGGNNKYQHHSQQQPPLLQPKISNHQQVQHNEPVDHQDEGHASSKDARDGSASSNSSREDRTKLDYKSDPSTRRAKSAKSMSRQVVETVPTKISLMITNDHDDDRGCYGGKFLPVNRTVRGQMLRNNVTSKRKY